MEERAYIKHILPYVATPWNIAVYYPPTFRPYFELRPQYTCGTDSTHLRFGACSSAGIWEARELRTLLSRFKLAFRVNTIYVRVGHI